jgi:RimJ/RimL family protein N-acetyltransferase
MTFAPTRDFTLVKSTLTHDSQMRMSSEDATDAASWEPNEDPRLLYLAVRDGGQLLGIFTFVPQNAICFEIHAAVLPLAWGHRSRQALRGALEFAWRETPARRVVASIPAYNRLAIALGRSAGMTQYGVNSNSFLRHGELWDQVLLGISKP